MTVQRQVINEMLHLRELFGTSIIIVTHDLGVVKAMADTVLVLKDGKKCGIWKSRGGSERIRRMPTHRNYYLRFRYYGGQSIHEYHFGSRTSN